MFNKIKFSPSVCYFSEFSGKISLKICAIKSGDKPNLENYCVFLVTLTNDLNGLEVEADGDILLSNEVHHTSTGDANLLPFAYGYVTSTGSLSSGTSNIGTVSKVATGQYKIEIANLGTGYIVQVTGVGGSSFILAKVMGVSSTYFTVSTWDTKADGYADCGFSFVVFKP